jgi:hypothetical protein
VNPRWKVKLEKLELMSLEVGIPCTLYPSPRLKVIVVIAFFDMAGAIQARMDGGSASVVQQ